MNKIRTALAILFAVGIFTAIGLTIADIPTGAYIALGFSFLIYIALFPAFWEKRGK